MATTIRWDSTGGTAALVPPYVKYQSPEVQEQPVRSVVRLHVHRTKRPLYTLHIPGGRGVKMVFSGFRRTVSELRCFEVFSPMNGYPCHES